MDPAGVRHGIIFGDGSIERGDYGRINLIGEKCELSRFFPEQRQREKEINGLPALYIYGGKAFIGFKDIPHISLPNSYILGFLRSEEHTSELQSLMRISYAVFCLKNKIYEYNHLNN